MTTGSCDMPSGWHSPPGWARKTDDVDGVPLWQWHGEPFYVATRDMDQLRFIGAALLRYERMSGEDLRSYVIGSVL